MEKEGHKYIFVVGGVMSGVGKGVASSSLALLLQERGYSVNLVKIDPYLNVDAGTMNPTEHGEVFVLDSGLETDQDMGNYERFLNRDLGPEDYMTSGMVYKTVIENERALKYGGKTIEAIPHVRDEILRRIHAAASNKESQISVIEIGGTVGDFQNALFIEAARVLKLKNPRDVVFVMVSYLPVPGTLGEMKTKPTQSAVRELNSYGVQPDFIIARSAGFMDEKRKEKLAIWCNVQPDHVISAPDVQSIYDVPLNFGKDNLGDLMLAALSLPKDKPADFQAWNDFVKRLKGERPEVSVGIVGKYFDTGDFVLADAYLSVIEALKFSGAELGLRPKIEWVNAKDIEKGDVEVLRKYDGIIVPGGFGETGIEGKIKTARFCRENKIPYFGLCYGLHMLVIEYARNVAGLTGAHTVEIDPQTKHPVIDVMPDQKDLISEGKYGGTMRLGSYPCKLSTGTIAADAYGAKEVNERHRHRYEVNPNYILKLTEAGLKFSGVSPDHKLMEIAELPKEEHPFYLGCQFHPELKARPLAPHPLFTKFLKVSASRDKS
ncbi:MAG TPA: CTP synthase [Candidatus Paceibacterota bacterium]|jgi:CTP synthase